MPVAWYPSLHSERLSTNRVRETGGNGGLSASPCLQLHQHDLKGLIAQIFRQVFSRRDKHVLPHLRRELFGLSIGKSKFSTGVGEEHRDACGMSVHDRLLVWAVADPQDAH